MGQKSAHLHQGLTTPLTHAEITPTSWWKAYLHVNRAACWTWTALQDKTLLEKYSTFVFLVPPPGPTPHHRYHHCCCCHRHRSFRTMLDSNFAAISWTAARCDCRSTPMNRPNKTQSSSIAMALLVSNFQNLCCLVIVRAAFFRLDPPFLDRHVLCDQTDRETLNSWSVTADCELKKDRHDPHSRYAYQHLAACAKPERRKAQAHAQWQKHVPRCWQFLFPSSASTDSPKRLPPVSQ